MIKRAFESRLKTLLGQFPVVTILGPRQCGKTSLVKSVLSDWTYRDMEKPSDAAPFLSDPEDQLNRLKEGFVLDEAQQIPALFPVLRSWIDSSRNQKGRAVLLGSASPLLIKKISESLAGRTGFLDMTPFQWSEVEPAVKSSDLEDLWFRGGFPEPFLLKSDDRRRDWFEAYARTFIQRDLTALEIGVSGPQMLKLWTMLAHSHGDIWNASQLAASLGVSYHTVARYTDILEQTFLVRKLPPYQVNLKKRMVKSPKVYLRDSGLLHYLLDIQKASVLHTHPRRGASWEGFIIEQIVSAAELVSPGTRAYYWRTQAGAEVDLILQMKGRLIPIEIKLHSAPDRSQFQGLTACMNDLKIKKGYVIYPGTEEYSLGESISTLSAPRLLAQPKKLLHL